jgi:NAD(P)-dependent dehydrogenase (short-subunit alcohol dehydrogenase family)
MSRLANKTALITGIGLETARCFLAEGARLIVTGTNPATIADAQAALGPTVPVLRSDAGNLAD